MVNPFWLKSIRRAADSNPRTSIRKASVLTTRPEGILGLQSYLLSKLEVSRKSLPAGPGPTRTSRPGFDAWRGQIILKV